MQPLFPPPTQTGFFNSQSEHVSAFLLTLIGGYPRIKVENFSVDYLVWVFGFLGRFVSKLSRIYPNPRFMQISRHNEKGICETEKNIRFKPQPQYRAPIFWKKNNLNLRVEMFIFIILIIYIIYLSKFITYRECGMCIISIYLFFKSAGFSLDP